MSFHGVGMILASVEEMRLAPEQLEVPITCLVREPVGAANRPDLCGPGSSCLAAGAGLGAIHDATGERLVAMGLLPENGSSLAPEQRVLSTLCGVLPPTRGALHVGRGRSRVHVRHRLVSVDAGGLT